MKQQDRRNLKVMILNFLGYLAERGGATGRGRGPAGTDVGGGGVGVDVKEEGGGEKKTKGKKGRGGDREGEEIDSRYNQCGLS